MSLSILNLREKAILKLMNKYTKTNDVKYKDLVTNLDKIVDSQATKIDLEIQACEDQISDLNSKIEELNFERNNLYVIIADGL